MRLLFLDCWKTGRKKALFSLWIVDFLAGKDFGQPWTLHIWQPLLNLETNSTLFFSRWTNRMKLTNAQCSLRYSLIFSNFPSWEKNTSFVRFILMVGSDTPFTQFIIFGYVWVWQGCHPFHKVNNMTAQFCKKKSGIFSVKPNGNKMTKFLKGQMKSGPDLCCLKKTSFWSVLMTITHQKKIRFGGVIVVDLPWGLDGGQCCVWGYYHPL